MSTRWHYWALWAMLAGAFAVGCDLDLVGCLSSCEPEQWKRTIIEGSIDATK